jgi:5-methylcytosine-specific restriction endonuclease McrA
VTATARMKAAALGFKTYIGRPCSLAQHNGERYTTTGSCLTCMQERYRTNSRTVRERSAERYVENRKTALSQQAAKRAANPKKYSDIVRRCKRKKPELYRSIEAAREARKLMQRCVCCTDEQITEVFKQAALCDKAEVDHIVQLSLGGPHCIKNLQALTVEDHIEKTRADCALRAESRQRNKLLLQWSYI